MRSGDSCLAAEPGQSHIEDKVELSEMREIDPQSEGRLTEALRHMAASSRQGAPPEIGAALATSFRRHHARRRAVRWARGAASAACLILAALLWIHTSSHQPSNAA